MHTLYKHICSFFVGYLTNKLRIIWTFSGEFVFYSPVRFFRLQFLAFLSGTTKRIHLFQNTVFIFVAYFLGVGGSGVGGSTSSFSGRFHCAAVTSVISISCQTRKPTTCRAVDFPKNVKESVRVERLRGERGWGSLATKCLLVFITCSLLFGALRSLKLPSSARKLFASDKWNWPRSQLGLSTSPPSLSLSLTVSLWLLLLIM